MTVVKPRLVPLNPNKVSIPSFTWNTPIAIDPPTPIAMARIVSKLLNQLKESVSRFFPKVSIIAAPIKLGHPRRNPK